MIRNKVRLNFSINEKWSPRIILIWVMGLWIRKCVEYFSHIYCYIDYCLKLINPLTHHKHHTSIIIYPTENSEKDKPKFIKTMNILYKL